MQYDISVSKMHMNANIIASKLLCAKLDKCSFDPSSVSLEDGFKYNIYIKDHIKSLNIKKKIEEDIFLDNNRDLNLVHKNKNKHISNVSEIIIKDKKFTNKIEALKIKIILSSIFIYIMLFMIGYHLAQLFIRPIKSQRERLNNFIKDSTHELNTPISALLMSLKLDLNDEKTQERISLSAKRISQIYNDLTYLFLRDNNKNIKNPKNINLKNILEEQLTYFKTLANKKNITINTNIKDVSYKMHSESFQRLSNNLISNAIKYTRHKGEINITLNSEKFSIQDNGIGIKKNKLDEVFNRFYRATNEQGGFGIGLDIVKTICREYKLKLKIRSQKNIGTTIDIYWKE